MTAEAQPQSEQKEAFELGVLTDPSTYNPGDTFRFLVHIAQNPDDKLGQLLVGTGDTFQTDDDEVVCTSLIDQNNPWVFTGGSGFIISSVGPGDVAAAYSTDTGLARPHRELRFADGDAVLEATSELDYNQLNIHSGVVGGVMVRVDAESGRELGSPQVNEQVRRIAVQHQLPVAEIPIQGHELHPGEAETTVSIGVAGAKLLQVVKPAEGRFVKIDVAEVPSGSPLDYSGNSPGYMARAMVIDGHGQVLENDTTLSQESRALIDSAIREATVDEEAATLVHLAHSDIARWLADDIEQ